MSGILLQLSQMYSWDDAYTRDIFTFFKLWLNESWVSYGADFKELCRLACNALLS